MKAIGRLFLKGLAVILPITLTAYILYWLGAGAESLARRGLASLFGKGWYFPGMGIMVAVALILLVGLVTRAWAVRKIIALVESILLRIPLVKTIYGGLRDLMDFLSAAGEERLGQTVMVTVAEDVRLMGMVTREDFSDLPEGIGDEETVAVYCQMAYQVGGYMLFVPRSRIQPVDMDVDDAMSFVLTAGMSTGGEEEEHTSPSSGQGGDEQ
jgi:uncharacterized membrane protein